MFVVCCCLTAIPNSNNDAPLTPFWRKKRELKALFVTLPNQLVSMKKRRSDALNRWLITVYSIETSSASGFHWLDFFLSHSSDFENSCFSLMAMIRRTYCLDTHTLRLKHRRVVCSQRAGDTRLSLGGQVCRFGCWQQHSPSGWKKESTVDVLVFTFP